MEAPENGKANVSGSSAVAVNGKANLCGSLEVPENGSMYPSCRGSMKWSNVPFMSWINEMDQCTLYVVDQTKWINVPSMSWINEMDQCTLYVVDQ